MSAMGALAARDARLLPDNGRPVRRLDGQAADDRRLRSRLDAGRRRVRHAAVRLRRGPPAGALPRGGRRVRPTASATRPRRSCAGRWRGSRYDEGMHLDVATGGELHVALAAGVPARPAGAARQQQVASTSCARRVEAASAASSSTRFDELDRLEALEPRRLASPTVLLRVTPGRRGAHPRVRRAPARTTPSSASASHRATPTAPSSGQRHRRRVELVGMHAHIGSQVFVRRLLRAARRGPGRLRQATLDLRRAVDRRRARRRLRRGRGGADDHPVGHGRPRRLRGEPASTASRHRRAGPGDRRRGRRHALHGRHDQGAARHPHLRRGRRRHERQPAAGALRQRLRDVPARAPVADRVARTVTVVGKHCESGDVLCATRGARRPRASATSSPRRSPAPTATRWARTTTRCTGPAVVFVRDGDARLVVRRETFDDLLLTDVG